MSTLSKRVLKEFETIIVPGVTGASMKSLLKEPDFNITIKLSSLFSDYVVGLEEEGVISASVVQELDLAWVQILESNA